MIERKKTLEKLMKFKDKQVIKVIVGIRRCGKSTLLEIFRDGLKKFGVKNENIFSMNFDDLKNQDYLKDQTLYKYLSKKLEKVKDGKIYLFLDEIQNVENFENVISSLYLDKNIDIYITGSNALMLSSELSTKLSGRYIEIKLLPFSFSEYHEFNDKENDFEDYLNRSSFPYASRFQSDQEIDDYLLGIYNTVLVKDIVQRKIVQDIPLLQDITRFLVSNIGNIVSKKKIADALTSGGRKTSATTVDNYIQALLDSFVIYRVDRYDVKGKKYLQTLEKYYVVDLGLKHLLVGRRFSDLGHNLENIVYLELVRRGLKVYIGKIGDKEIDFVAIKNGNLEYYQVTTTMMDENVQIRELRPLRAIKDNYPKYILSLDKNSINDEGIQHKNLIDWLLDE
jgi:predicted AAA+ superfamily ATPase